MATENGLHVVVFYTHLVELKQYSLFRVSSSPSFYTHLVELKLISRKAYKSFISRFYTDLVELKLWNQL